MNSQSPTPKELEVEKLFTSLGFLAPSAELIEAILGYTEAQLAKKDKRIAGIASRLKDSHVQLLESGGYYQAAQLLRSLPTEDTNKSEGVE